MIAGAKTAADHKAIAECYYAEAAKARAKADEHEQMALYNLFSVFNPGFSC